MNPTEYLEQFGFNQQVDAKRQAAGATIEQIARIVAEHRGLYEIATIHGNHRAVVTGKIMLTATGRDDYPAVGDWVVIHEDDQQAKTITGILPRTTTLRKRYGGKESAQLIVANADVAFVVESVSRDYSLNRYERYVVIAREGGVRPVIVFNKSDLITKSELQAKIAELHERFNDIDIIATSTVAADGTAALAAYIQPGLTYCFLGSSGAGKSSLINSLLAGSTIETTEISQKTGRGMHTTTGRETYVTQAGGIIIDNPGSREVGVTDAHAGIREVFTDIEQLALGCKFANCSHNSEPGCQVIDALRSGQIDAAHYDNYKKLQKEVKHYSAGDKDKRQNEKKLGKFMKAAKKSFKQHDDND